MPAELKLLPAGVGGDSSLMPLLRFGLTAGMPYTARAHRSAMRRHTSLTIKISGLVAARAPRRMM